MPACTETFRPIYSSLGGDASLSDIVSLFVDEMPERLDVLRQAAEEGDLEELARLAHQLKGAAGSYGFNQITPYVTYLESLARERKSEILLLATVEDLISLCSQMQAGTPAED